MSSTLAGKKILIGITGAAHAYQACDLISLLTKAGAEVQAVLTQNGARFVSPITLKALTGKEAPSTMWPTDSDFVVHVGLCADKDLILIAPATANIIAKAANGICDDLLSSVIVSRPCPLMIAPAMHFLMWLNPATQANVERLKGWGVAFAGPDSMTMPNGEKVTGQFRAPADLVKDIERFFAIKDPAGLKV
ncbi:MAG: hypothetical protein LUC43_09890 [Burkholderiales bacterium]|nr:hypothetical protein [Burkholderiales bacterium]